MASVVSALLQYGEGLALGPDADGLLNLGDVAPREWAEVAATAGGSRRRLFDVERLLDSGAGPGAQSSMVGAAGAVAVVGAVRPRLPLHGAQQGGEGLGAGVAVCGCGGKLWLLFCVPCRLWQAADALTPVQAFVSASQCPPLPCFSRACSGLQAQHAAHHPAPQAAQHPPQALPAGRAAVDAGPGGQGGRSRRGRGSQGQPQAAFPWQERTVC